MIAKVGAFVLVILALAATGAGAYFLGHAAAPDDRDVTAAHKVASKDAFIESFATARVAGLSRGTRAGRQAGRTAGRDIGGTQGAEAGAAEVDRREGVSAAVAEEAAADVAATEAAEAEALYYETHPWAAPYPSTSPPPDGSLGVAPGCYPVEGVPCD
jgi:hypothetical protein